MSVVIALENLRTAIEERGANAYLLTVSDDARPHAVYVPVRWDGAVIVAEVGKRSAAHAGARPAVSLLFSVRHQDDYSLIVDGSARVDSDDSGHRLRITPQKAVLHRPAATPDPASACGADCVPLVGR